MRYLLLVLAVGALFTDWVRLRIHHHNLEAEVDDLKSLVVRYERTGRAQENALLSCRGMVDQYVDAGQRSALFAVVAAEKLKRARQHKKRTLVASSVGY